MSRASDQETTDYFIFLKSKFLSSHSQEIVKNLVLVVIVVLSLDTLRVLQSRPVLCRPVLGEGLWVLGLSSYSP